MGMFDYLRCDAPLPDGYEPPDGYFQTKDFDCEMVTHVITKNGRLMHECVDRVEEVPKEERPYPNDNGFLGLCGSIRRHTSLHDSNFHGRVNFYDYNRDKEWHEYNAKFTDGQLVEIVKVPESDE